MFYYYMDPTYILVLIGVVICMAASSKMNRTFQKYSRVRSHNGMTGREAAERILHSQGIYDVRVEHVSGNLTDHYDPRIKYCVCQMLHGSLHLLQLLELQRMSAVTHYSMQGDMCRSLSEVHWHR